MLSWWWWCSRHSTPLVASILWHVAVCVYITRVHKAGDRSGPFFSRVSFLLDFSLGYSLNSHFLRILLRDDQRFQNLGFFPDFLVCTHFHLSFIFLHDLPSSSSLLQNFQNFENLQHGTTIHKSNRAASPRPRREGSNSHLSRDPT